VQISKRLGDAVRRRLRRSREKALYYHSISVRGLFRQSRAHSFPAPLIVSITSFPPRFPNLKVTLKCLLDQSVRADQTILWIAEEDQPLLPSNVLSLEKRGLTIRPCENIRSYKKILPAISAFPDAFIVTADDDSYYDRDWLARFEKAYDPQPRIYCQRARRIKLNDKGFPDDYHRWPVIPDRETGDGVFLIGAGGVMYPPRVMHPEVLDVERARSLCPSNDDIWLYWMARLGGATVRKIRSAGPPITWPFSQTVSLWDVNGPTGENDRQISAMMGRYGWVG
jgi:hypothetical protein